MSDWRSRAKPIERNKEETPVSGWRSRAKPAKSVADSKDYAQISGVDSALVGGLEGGLFGFAGETMGAIKTAGDVLSGRTSFSEIPDQYAKRRDSYQKYINESADQNPTEHHSAELAGGVATSFIPGVGLAKGSKIAAMAIPSAVAGLGYSEGESFLEKAGDAAIGGATGVVAGKLFDGVSNILGKATDKLRNFAKEQGATRLLKGAGAMTADFRRMDEMGTRLSNADWLAKNKIVSAGSDLGEAAKRAGSKKQDAGVEIGKILDGADKLRDEAIQKIDDLFSSAVKSGEISPELAQSQKAAVIRQVQEEFGFNPSNLAGKADDFIASKQKSPTFRKGSESFFKDHAEANRAVAEEYGPMSLREGLQEKVSQRDEIGPNMTVSKRNKKRVYDWTRDELDRAVGNYERLGEGIKKLDGSIPGSGKFLPSADDAVQDRATSMVSQYRDANKEMAIAAEMEKMARRSSGRESSNSVIGLRDVMVGGAVGVGSEDPQMGFAAALGNKALRQYGNAAAGKTLWKLGKFLDSNPSAAKTYAPMIQEAMRRGMSNALMANQLLAKEDPEYANFLQQMIGQEEE